MAYFAGQGQRTVLLGSAVVDGRMNYDVIHVGARESFQNLQFYVGGGPVDIQHMRVRYADGTEEHIPMGGIVPAGGLTPPIRLSGNPAGIEDVSFWYASTSWRANPVVTLYGGW